MKSTSLLKKSIAYSNMTSTPVKIALLVLAIIVLVSILIFNCAVFSKYTYTYLTKIDSTVMENLASVTLRFSSKSTRRSQSNEPTMKFNQWRNKSNTLVINDATQRGKTLVVDDPISKPKNCLKDHCKEYLTIPELSALKTCQRESARARRTADIKVHIKENNCSFIDKSSRKPVALVSTEGSGNTWLRGLLEKTTGICSGFIYCDYFMRREGFIGEMIKSGSVLVVKTHTATPQWYGVKYKRPKRDEPYYGSAVFIVRNPYHSLIAEWNRRATNEIIIKKHIPHNESHTNVVPKEYWGTYVIYSLNKINMIARSWYTSRCSSTKVLCYSLKGMDSYICLHLSNTIMHVQYSVSERSALIIQYLKLYSVSILYLLA